MRVQRWRFFLIIVPIFFLSGCTSSLWNRYPPPNPTRAGLIVGTAGGVLIGAAAGGGVGAGFGAVAGGVLGASFGDIIQAHYTLVEKLQYNGVHVIQVGDDVELILPTDRFFLPHSPQLNMHYYPVLNNVGDFLRQFQKVSIKIACYTDDLGPWQRNLAMSKQRANNLMIYLWNYGVDARLMYTVGYGPKDPIASNATERGRQLNRRVVISMRKIEDPYDY